MGTKSNSRDRTRTGVLPVVDSIATARAQATCEGPYESEVLVTLAIGARLALFSEGGQLIAVDSTGAHLGAIQGQAVERMSSCMAQAYGYFGTVVEITATGRSKVIWYGQKRSGFE